MIRESLVFLLGERVWLRLEWWNMGICGRLREFGECVTTWYGVYLVLVISKSSINLLG